MKAIATFLLAFCLWTPLQAQIDITAEDWQKDLTFLQHTVHSEYPFLFKKITAEKFDARVKDLRAAIPEMQEHEIVAGFSRIVSSFGYGHTSLRLHGGPFRYHRLPINLYHFSDGIYIEGVKDDYEEILGTELLAINGTPVDEALKAIRPMVPAENEQFFKAHGLLYLTSPEFLHAHGVIDELGDSLTLTLERDGMAFDQDVTAVSSRHFPVAHGFSKQTRTWLSSRPEEETPLYLEDLNRKYAFEYLPEHKTVYVRHSEIQDDPQEDIPSFYQKVFEFVEANDVEKFVLDVRLNGGGNNYKNKPIVTGLIESQKINQPGKLFVIIGRRTFSACQNLVNELHNYTNAIFVGEPTGENINFYGDNRQVKLPSSKLVVSLSWAWWQDKPQWENDDWLAPHLAVDLSFDDYCNNRDPVLQAALDFQGDDFVPDPMKQLAELFKAGKMDELKWEARKLIDDPRYRYVNFEGKVNDTGYKLLGDGQAKMAIRVFELNAEMYPESANCRDSLAEANWKAGNIDKAIELYNRAIALDPDGAIGENARAMLEKIRTDRR